MKDREEDERFEKQIQRESMEGDLRGTMAQQETKWECMVLVLFQR